MEQCQDYPKQSQWQLTSAACRTLAIRQEKLARAQLLDLRQPDGQPEEESQFKPGLASKEESRWWPSSWEEQPGQRTHPLTQGRKQ